MPDSIKEKLKGYGDPALIKIIANNELGRNVNQVQRDELIEVANDMEKNGASVPSSDC